MVQMKNFGRPPCSTRPRVLGPAAMAAFLLATGAAHADLTGEFADALDVDPSFVTGANGATDIAFADDGRAVVTRRTGEIVVRLTDGTKSQTTGQFPNLDTSFQEEGLTGVVRDPRAPNAFFFYADNGPDTDKHRVYAGVLNDDNTVTVETSSLVAPMKNPGDSSLPGALNHNGGGLQVYDGHLYIVVGDTGANMTPPTNKYSSCLNIGNGSILRINLDGTIPDDNPLTSETMVTSCTSVTGSWGMAAPDTRIYAWGLRNAFRFWIDPHTGRMWIGAVGETTRESVSVSDPPDSYMGQHFGYPFEEGTTVWGDLAGMNCEDMTPSRACTPPVTDYENMGRMGQNCVIGGLIPEGCGWDAAFGGALYYWFADNGASWVHGLEVKPDRSGVASSTAVDIGTFSGAGPAAIRQGPGGAIYMVNNAQGSVFEIKPKEQTGDDCMSGGGMGGMGGMAGMGGVGGDSGAGTGGDSAAGTDGGGAGGSTDSGGATNAGSGGMTPATGGTPATTGGASSTGGSSTDVGGSTSTGGAATTGGTSGPGSGGGPSSTGGANQSGTGPASVTNKDSGSCNMVAGGNGSLAWLMTGLGLTGLALGRRRRRKR